MGRRIISGARPHVPADADTGGVMKRSRMVIADWGPTAELLVFPPGEPVDTGARFHYRGSIWVITGRRRDSRILVAEPAAN